MKKETKVEVFLKRNHKYFVFTYYSLPNKEKKKKRNFRFNTLKNKITKKNNKEIEK